MRCRRCLKDLEEQAVYKCQSCGYEWPRMPAHPDRFGFVFEWLGPEGNIVQLAALSKVVVPEQRITFFCMLHEQRVPDRCIWAGGPWDMWVTSLAVDTHEWLCQRVSFLRLQADWSTFARCVPRGVSISLELKRET